MEKGKEKSISGKKMRLNITQKLEKLPKGILIDDKIKGNSIRGVYGVFSYDENGYPLTARRVYTNGTVENYEYIWE